MSDWELMGKHPVLSFSESTLLRHTSCCTTREERAKEAEEIKSLLRQERERTEAELRQRQRF